MMSQSSGSHEGSVWGWWVASVRRLRFGVLRRVLCETSTAISKQRLCQWERRHLLLVKDLFSLAERRFFSAGRRVLSVEHHFPLAAHPFLLEQHHFPLAAHPFLLEQHHFLLAAHPFLSDKHHFLLAEHPFLLEQDHFLLAAHPFLFEEHHFLLAAHPFLLDKHDFLLAERVFLLAKCLSLWTKHLLLSEERQAFPSERLLSKPEWLSPDGTMRSRTPLVPSTYLSAKGAISFDGRGRIFRKKCPNVPHGHAIGKGSRDPRRGLVTGDPGREVVRHRRRAGEQ
jgi:hypothetical protein